MDVDAVEREILDAAFAELDVGVADGCRDDGGVVAGDFEYVVGHVHTDDFGGDGLEILRVVINRAAKGGFGFGGSRRVAFAGGGFGGRSGEMGHGCNSIQA